MYLQGLFSFFTVVLLGCSSSDAPNDAGVVETPEVIKPPMETPLPVEVSGRYYEEVFDDYTLKTVTYGENTTQAGAKKILELDIYEPKGDIATNRPVFLFAHGGGFTQGSKEAIKGLGFLQKLAKSGFVVASMSYRLIDVAITESSQGFAILNAVEDMRAAIRFFRKDKATTNLYKVDTDQLFIGGYSAGAITALHTAYLNSDDKIKTFIPPLVPYVNSNGGIEGNSGNPGYSSSVKGVINISGAIINTQLIDNSIQTLYSLHGENDSTVAIGATPSLKGSRVIHERATEQNVINKLNAVSGAEHDVLYKCTPCREGLQKFLADQIAQ